MTKFSEVLPSQAIEGGRITLLGDGFPTSSDRVPTVRVGGVPARVVFAARRRLICVVPPLNDGGPQPVTVDDVPGGAVVSVGARHATGLHQVDNPTFDHEGNLYVTYSGTRGQQVPVSIFRVRSNGTRETFSSGIVNATSMAVGPDNRLYVSSRFEGTVFRLGDDGSAEPFATDLGVACGLVFDREGTLWVGDRSGTIFAVASDGHARPVASLPPSVAAFHLALGPDAALYVSGPTLSAYDAIYRVTRDGAVSIRSQAFGRPQGLAFDTSGHLHVVEALAGSSGVWRLLDGQDPELIISGPGLVGLAFDGLGGSVVCSNETAYRLS